MIESISEPHFDWYAATVRDLPDDVLTVMRDGLQVDTVEPWEKGMHGYTAQHVLKRRGAVVARMLSGGANGWPHVWASGEHTDPLVEVMRGQWGDRHTVSRVDSAIDIDGSGGDVWDQLLARCVQAVEDNRLKVDQQGDWLRGQDGRTFYLGGRKSPVMARLYEKGKQVMGVDGRSDLSPDWCRLELQVRPAKEAKRVMAHASPGEVWGAAKWSRALLQDVAGISAVRIPMVVARETDDARARRYLLRQYGPTLINLERDLGSWARVGEWLGRGVGALDEMSSEVTSASR